MQNAEQDEDQELQLELHNLRKEMVKMPSTIVLSADGHTRHRKMNHARVSGSNIYILGDDVLER